MLNKRILEGKTVLLVRHMRFNTDLVETLKLAGANVIEPKATHEGGAGLYRDDQVGPLVDEIKSMSPRPDIVLVTKPFLPELGVDKFSGFPVSKFVKAMKQEDMPAMVVGRALRGAELEYMRTNGATHYDFAETPSRDIPDAILGMLAEREQGRKVS